MTTQTGEFSWSAFCSIFHAPHPLRIHQAPRTLSTNRQDLSLRWLTTWFDSHRCNFQQRSQRRLDKHIKLADLQRVQYWRPQICIQRSLSSTWNAFAPSLGRAIIDAAVFSSGPSNDYAWSPAARTPTATFTFLLRRQRGNSLLRRGAVVAGVPASEGHDCKCYHWRRPSLSFI